MKRGTTTSCRNGRGYRSQMQAAMVYIEATTKKTHRKLRLLWYTWGNAIERGINGSAYDKEAAACVVKVRAITNGVYCRTHTRARNLDFFCFGHSGFSILVFRS